MNLTPLWKYDEKQPLSGEYCTYRCRNILRRIAKGTTARFLMTIMLALCILLPLQLSGQVLFREGALPAFEVESIKLMPHGPPHSPAPQGGSTVRLFFTVKMLIMYAYNLPSFNEERIANGSGWMDETYDIEGKFSDADYARIQTMSAAERNEQVQLRLQSLLKERFHLQVHPEKREQTIYALEVAKGGPKISKAKHEVPDRFGITHKGTEYELKVTGTDMDGFAGLLGREPEVAGRTIVNRTGLEGTYDLTLHWTRVASAGPDSGSPASEVSGPSYFTAIQEQLGLRLSPTKGQVDTIVVDHIEKPSAN